MNPKATKAKILPQTTQKTYLFVHMYNMMILWTFSIQGQFFLFMIDQVIAYQGLHVVIAYQVIAYRFIVYRVIAASGYCSIGFLQHGVIAASGFCSIGLLHIGLLHQGQNIGFLSYRVFVQECSGFCHIGLLHIGFLAYRVFACRVFVHACSGFCISGYWYRVIDIGFLTVGFLISGFDLEPWASFNLNVRYIFIFVTLYWE
jgi:hypothetical protein